MAVVVLVSWVEEGGASGPSQGRLVVVPLPNHKIPLLLEAEEVPIGHPPDRSSPKRAQVVEEVAYGRLTITTTAMDRHYRQEEEDGDNSNNR